MNQPMKLYLTERVENAIRREFAYIFVENKYPGIPEVTLERIHDQADFVLDNGTVVTPIEVMHLRLPVLGFRIGNFAYITDANFIAESSIQKLKGVDTLVLNALRHEKHISHFTLNEAIEMSRIIGAKQTYFTHISHQLGLHEEVSANLPPGFALAYDGLSMEV
jgi:phosphoribosyl 1,2-cyclic phosphate phosphodiesterase